MINLIIWCFIFSRTLILVGTASPSTSSTDRIDLYKIEGQIVFPPNEDVLNDIRILVDEGQYVGIPRIDGTFVIAGIPSGSYIVSVSSPFYTFEPVRVDINTKGKIRARAVNYLEPGKVITMKYPLRFEAYIKSNYFQKREVYHLTDIIFHPTFFVIIVLVASLIFLPKFAPQPHEIEQFIQPNMNLPDITDWVIRWIGGPRRRQPASYEAVEQNKTETTPQTEVQSKTKRAKKKKH